MKVDQAKLGVGTICYLHSNDSYLLGEKKYGGAQGKVNGFGGKIETTDQSIYDAVKREFREETSIQLNAPKYCGIIEIFKNETRKAIFYLFKADDFIGQPQESEEMKVYWVKNTEVPFEKMWASDALWLPLFLKNDNIRVKLYFQEGNDKADRMEVTFNATLDETYHENFI